VKLGAAVTVRVRLVLWATLALAPRLALAQEGTPCEGVGTKAATETGVGYDPAAILLSKGLDPEALRFTVGDTGDGFVTISATYKGEKAGWITTERAADVDETIYPTITRIDVFGAAQGKGLGTLLYLAAGRVLRERGHGLLRKSELTSADANRTWDRLVKLGLAEVVSTEFGDAVRLKKGVLDGDVGIAAGEFVARRP
jgi:GNAT superfamily N-acetyltransferase